MNVYADEVTVVRAPAAEGPYGSDDRDWSTASRTVTVATVQPLSSSEDTVEQERTVTRWRVFLPPDADVHAADRVEWDGVSYEVDGDVERWKRRGVLHHFELVMRRVTGD